MTTPRIEVTAKVVWTVNRPSQLKKMVLEYEVIAYVYIQRDAGRRGYQIIASSSSYGLPASNASNAQMAMRLLQR